MPGRDRTGPDGSGAMTGYGDGDCYPGYNPIMRPIRRIFGFSRIPTGLSLLGRRFLRRRYRTQRPFAPRRRFARRRWW